MKNLTLLFILVSSSLLFAGLTSPFKSTVEGITINNTHNVGPNDNVFRGMAPLGKIAELKSFGITDFLIFKNQTRNEIDKQLEEIKSLYNPKIKQFDFFWHDFSSYKESCIQTIQALRYIRKISSSKNRKLFFHCTVGEDRTGMLAGLWRMLSQGWSVGETFKNEMCERGYENGNGNKPDYVVNEIRSDLTPLFLYMGKLIENKKLRIDYLTERYCTDTIEMDHDYRCKTSSKFDPDL